jgi:triacylglycerol lipase
MNIVLVHGVLGFKRLAGHEYFNGVEKHLREKFRVPVAVTEEAPLSAVSERARQLRVQIPAAYTDIVFIAHSMGGLDVRYMLQHHPELVSRTKAVLCLATPHRGSPVATSLDLLNPLLHFAVDDLAALGAQTIDGQCPDIKGICYGDVAAIGRLGDEPTSEFFEGMRQLIHEPNDGVVPLSSATHGRNVLEKVHCDHADLLGHDLDDLPDLRPRRFEHLALYDRIVQAALNHPAR